MTALTDDNGLFLCERGPISGLLTSGAEEGGVGVPGWGVGFHLAAPGATRTPNLLIRSQTLYPIELRAATLIIAAVPS